MKLTLIIALLLLAGWSLQAEEIKLLNVSYDPTREFYKEFNQAFTKYWKGKTSDQLTVDQSHGGSGKQARSVIDGIGADVVTLALANDIDEISSRAKLLPANWQSRLPYNSSPYTSTIIFVVRRGNPKGITDWDDLIKPGVSLITPNPKTGGAPRWTYLAARGYALKKYGSQEKAKEFVKRLYQNVAVLDSGARGSLTTFAKNGQGDVLLTWENEAFLSVAEFGSDKFQIVYPSISILAEPSVAWVDKVTEKHGTTHVAQEYLKYLYSEEGQALAAKHHYRPRNQAALARGKFAPIQLFSLQELYGSWALAQKAYFVDGAEFDQIYKK